MKSNYFKTWMRTFAALTCVVSLVSVEVITVYATPVDKLQQQTDALEDELDSLQENLYSLSSQITELANKINLTNESIKKTELDLVAAKLNEEMQYDAMKKRIKFMYETGNPSFIEMICASESFTEFLNKTEFVKTITDYDRDVLQELETVRKDIAKKEELLKQEKESLQVMQKELSSQQKELNSTLASTKGKLKASSKALAEAKAAQEAANNASNNKPNKPTNPNGGSSTTQKPSSGSVSSNDLVLLAALLQCEAGTSNYNALLAVATVVMNRVESRRFPNTIRGVIYQKGQFSPTWNGSLKRVLSKGPASLCYTVAQDALNGKRLKKVDDCLFFNAKWATNKNGVLVGGNIFW